MNILFYCDEYPPVRNGGIGSVVKIVAESLAERGHRVVVAGDYSRFKQEDLKPKEDINGVKIIRFLSNEYAGLSRKFLLLILLFTKTLKLNFVKNKIQTKLVQYNLNITNKKLQKLISDNEIDLIELVDYQDFLVNFVKGEINYHRFSVPTVLRIHGSVSFLRHYKDGHIPDSTLENDKRYFEIVDEICSVSDFAGNFVREYIIDKPIKVIYNPIESSFFENTTLESKSRNILFFGKIVKTKGAYDLIQAFNIVAKKNKEINLVLVGTGNLEEAKRYIDDNCRDRVFFKGFMNKRDLLNEIDNSLFCVLPSYYENFSMAALEVLARKKALIYTLRASGRELINDNENGLLVEPTDINVLADKIELLIEDNQLRNTIAQNGYDSCKERFSTDVIISQLERYYQEIINKKKK